MKLYDFYVLSALYYLSASPASVINIVGLSIGLTAILWNLY